MKNQFLAILMVTLQFVGCVHRPVTTPSHDIVPKYYAYNSHDTIGNEPYRQMLRIDSARVDYLLERPLGLVPAEDIDKINDEDILSFSEAEASWFEMLKLCSKRRYEDALSLYIKEESNVGTALATTTNKFDLDFSVVGVLLNELLEKEEAADILVRFLENDKLQTEGVIAYGAADGGGGFIPPDYPLLIKTLGAEYLNLGDESKAEDLIEPLRNAVYMLSDDVWDNEQEIAIYKTAIYHSSEDYPKLKATLEDYRAFVIGYSEKSDENHEELVGRLDFLIKELE